MLAAEGVDGFDTSYADKNLDRYIKDNFQTAMDYHYIQPYYQPVIRTSSRQLCSFDQSYPCCAEAGYHVYKDLDTVCLDA